MSFDTLPRDVHLLIPKATKDATREEEWFRASLFRTPPEDSSKGVRWTNRGIAPLASVNKAMRQCCSPILFSGLLFLDNRQLKQIFSPPYNRWVALVILRAVVFFKRRPAIASRVRYETPIPTLEHLLILLYDLFLAPFHRTIDCERKLDAYDEVAEGMSLLTSQLPKLERISSLNHFYPIWIKIFSGHPSLKLVEVAMPAPAMVTFDDEDKMFKSIERQALDKFVLLQIDTQDEEGYVKLEASVPVHEGMTVKRIEALSRPSVGCLRLVCHQCQPTSLRLNIEADLATLLFLPTLCKDTPSLEIISFSNGGLGFPNALMGRLVSSSKERDKSLPALGRVLDKNGTG